MDCEVYMPLDQWCSFLLFTTTCTKTITFKQKKFRKYPQFLPVLDDDLFACRSVLECLHIGLFHRECTIASSCLALLASAREVPGRNPSDKDKTEATFQAETEQLSQSAY